MKYPQYTLPRALKISIFLIFAVNALFQWFLVGLVPHNLYGVIASADAPYAQALEAVGMTGFPIILLCIGIAFGGDLSTINPGIAAPARYIYAMAEDHALPGFLGKVHPKYKTPHVAVIVVGIINFILIATGSINYIASVSLISLAVCYMIGCLAFLGLRKRYPDLKRTYRAPAGVFGSWFTIVAYIFMLIFADKVALLTAAIIAAVSIIYAVAVAGKHQGEIRSIQEEVGVLEEPSAEEKKKLDKEYRIWKYATIMVTVIALGIYFIPLMIHG